MNSEHHRSKVEVMASLVMGEAAELVQKAEAATAAAANVEREVREAAEKLVTLLQGPAINAEVNKAGQKAVEEAKKQIHLAAAEAVAGTLKRELAGLQAAVVEASNQLAGNRRETRKWVIAVAVISSTLGGLFALVLGRIANLI